MTDIVHESIKSLTIIPGSGEFAYDTKVITDGYGYVFNDHQGNGKSDAMNTIDGLHDKFPNLKNVSLVVGWYMDSTDAGSLTIAPRVEDKYQLKGDTWKVGDITRKKAILSEGGEGTPSDASILHVVKYLTDQGYNVTLYPMLFGDDEDKSWRGEVEAGSKADVDHFYQQYSKFIKHYASLEGEGVKMKDMISGYIIGSEMEKLLKYDDGSHEYYAVQKMAELATDVKGIVGSDVKTIYAANWTEYGINEDGYYHLDPLYEKVDTVGIDAYFPLTDGLKQDQITKEVIKEGWHSGINYDYWVDEETGRKEKIDDHKYAIKDVEYWYTHDHINADGTKTSWVPSQKEVIATEIGFPSVDATTNDPSSFYAPDMPDVSHFPDKSTGTADAKAQLLAIEATIEYWNEVHANDTEHKLDKLFADDGGLVWWSYDIRGDVSKIGDDDAEVYQYGHWIKDAPEELVSATTFDVDAS